MQRFLIQCVNVALLIIIFIGLPVATQLQYWKLQISWAPTSQALTFWGLALAAIGNVTVAATFIKGRKAQSLCACWAFVFVGLLFLEYAFIRDWINFNWLRKSLLWVQRHF